MKPDVPQHPSPVHVTCERLDPLPHGWVRLLIAGFGYPFRGLRFLKREPMLLPLAVMPAVLNLGLALIGVVVAFFNAPGLLGWLWQRPEAVDLWSACLVGLWVFVMVVLALVMGSIWLALVYAVAGLVATPFTDYLTEQVELKVLGLEGQDFRLARFLRDISWSVAHSVLNVIAWICVMGPLLLLNLVPGIGSLVYGALAGTATAYFLAREMHDGCMTRRRLPWLGKQRLVMKQLPLMLGFGFGTMVLFWIPGLNLVMLPVAHVGGALLYCRLAHNGLAPLERQG